LIATDAVATFSSKAPAPRRFHAPVMAGRTRPSPA
jgi:hypothetical protein